MVRGMMTTMERGMISTSKCWWFLCYDFYYYFQTPLILTFHFLSPKFKPSTLIQHLKWERSLDVLIEVKRLDLKTFFRTSINNGRFDEGTDEYNTEANQFIDAQDDIIKLNDQKNLQKKELLEFQSPNKVIVRNSVSSTTISNNDTTTCSNNPQDDAEEPV